MVFPVVMYGWESWTIKKFEHQRIDAFELVLEKTLESPLDCKDIQPVHPKGNQSWVFFGRNDAKAETPVLWPSASVQTEPGDAAAAKLQHPFEGVQGGE